jgi:hypothetical protein
MMKVIATFTDGQTRTVEISDPVAFKLHGPADAIALAKNHFSPEELANIKAWEIEEEFL